MSRNESDSLSLENLNIGGGSGDASIRTTNAQLKEVLDQVNLRLSSLQNEVQKLEQELDTKKKRRQDVEQYNNKLKSENDALNTRNQTLFEIIEMASAKILEENNKIQLELEQLDKAKIMTN